MVCFCGMESAAFRAKSSCPQKMQASQSEVIEGTREKTDHRILAQIGLITGFQLWNVS